MDSKPFTVVECEQRSPEWFRHRLGCVTSSTAHKFLTKVRRGGYSTGRQNLLMQLALEEVTGKSCESRWESSAMQQGSEREKDALGQYEALTGRLVQTCGFLKHNTLHCGASLDGYLGDFEIIVEAKSPIPATHWEYLSTGKIPADYHSQVIHQLFVTGAQACDWLSWCPEFPAPANVKIVRVERNEAEMTSYELMLRLFLDEVQAQVQKIQEVVVRMAVSNHLGVPV